MSAGARVDQSNASDGSKVVRGPDWRWGDQDGGAGKVGRLQGSVKSNGWVDVKWPSGDSNTYRAGADGKYDLALAVDGVCPKGHVLRMADPQVGYQCDVCGRVGTGPRLCCKLETCDFDMCADCAAPQAGGKDQARSSVRVGAHNAKVGLRVRRGPNWMWDEQDGGAGTVGLMTSCFDIEGWVGVRWPSGESFNYRAGADDMYDLILAEDDSAGSSGTFASAAKKGDLIVGDQVMLSSDFAIYADAAGGPLRPGDVGTLIEDDGTGKPYYVLAANGDRWWYEAPALVKASKDGRETAWTFVDDSSSAMLYNTDTGDIVELIFVSNGWFRYILKSTGSGRICWSSGECGNQDISNTSSIDSLKGGNGKRLGPGQQFGNWKTECERSLLVIRNSEDLLKKLILTNFGFAFVNEAEEEALIAFGGEERPSCSLEEVLKEIARRTDAVLLETKDPGKVETPFSTATIQDTAGNEAKQKAELIKALESADINREVDKLLAKLETLGVYCCKDLEHLEAEDVESLGLSVIDKRKFLKLIPLKDKATHRGHTDPASPSVPSSTSPPEPVRNQELDLLASSESSLLHRVVGASKSIERLDNRLFERPYTLRIGNPVEAARGLEDRMNVQSATFLMRCAKGVDGIKEEVLELVNTNSEAQFVQDWLQYVLEENTSEKEFANGIRDAGRGSVNLNYFETHPKALEARLTKEEVVALRLYTTHAFSYMNGPLRDDQRHQAGKPCPLPVATAFAEKGIKKLRALRAGDTSVPVLWRGMRNLDYASAFMRDGGTELGFMSTSSDMEVAVRYSLSPHSLLFKVVPDNYLGIGADVQWLSAFPGESEVLYPPLTFLKPTGRTTRVSCRTSAGQTVSYTILEVRPTMA